MLTQGTELFRMEELLKQRKEKGLKRYAELEEENDDTGIERLT